MESLTAIRDAIRQGASNNLVGKLRDKAKSEWAEKNNLTEFNSTLRFKGFLYDFQEGSFPGWMDHASVWKKDGKTVLAVSQPYQLDADGLKAISENADKMNLKVIISSAPGWYCPGDVLFIELWKKSTLLK